MSESVDILSLFEQATRLNISIIDSKIVSSFFILTYPFKMNLL